MDQRALEQLNPPIYATFCCRYDGDLILEAFSDSIYPLLGIDRAMPLAGKSVFDLILPSETARIRMELHAQLESGSDVELLLPFGEDKWVFGRGQRVDQEGEVRLCGIFVSVRRIKNMFDDQRLQLAEYRERLSETAERAARDSLTKLYNSQTTRSLCEEYIAGGNKSFALLIIDVDRLKRVNDSYGHMVGDKAIVSFADGIKKLFRNNDIVGRIGGDEFLVLMKDVDQRDIVNTRSAQVLAAFENIAFGPISKGELSCSVGVAFVKNNTASYDTLFCMADEALYQAKDAGRRCYVVRENNGI